MELILPAHQCRLIDRCYTFSPPWRWQERVVSWKETDPRVKGGDGSGPFRILSLANSADAEATLTLARRVYLAGSPFINLAVFETHAVKYDNRCESDGGPSRISEDKSWQKKRARGHQPPSKRSSLLTRTVCKSNHRDNTMLPARIWYNAYSRARVFPWKVCGLLMRRLRRVVSDSELVE